MNMLETIIFVERIKWWTTTILVGVFRISIIGACVKYIFWG